MGWFRADFGGKKGMKNIFKKHLIIPQDADPDISFNKIRLDVVFKQLPGTESLINYINA